MNANQIKYVYLSNKSLFRAEIMYSLINTDDPFVRITWSHFPYIVCSIGRDYVEFVSAGPLCIHMP